MTAELTLEGCIDTAEALGLPHPGLVEKDFHVVVALRALSAFATGNPRLVFGGGTSLCRAFRAIERMSEDIDLRIVSDSDLSAGERKKFRESVSAALAAAGFQFDPADRELHEVHDSGRTFTFYLSYPALANRVESLRPGVRIEISSWPLRMPPEWLSITSFWGEARNEKPEVQAIPCVAIAETAADKLVALCRRIAQERESGSERDNTLLRHAYDLHRLRPSLDLGQMAPMMREILSSDAETRGRQFARFREDPVGVSKDALRALSEDAAYAEAFRIFQRDMVYGETVELSDCLPILHELASMLDKR